MSISYKYLWILSSFFVLSCNSDHNHAGHNHDHSHQPQQETLLDQHASTEVELTHKQIETIGLSVGAMENLKIAGFIKANGILDLPPDEIATITAPANGFVQSTKGEYLVGSYVQRGTVLARLEHPDYLQLQQDYLELTAQLTYSQQEVERQRELSKANAGVLKSLQEATSILRRQEAQIQGLAAQLRYLGIEPTEVAAGNLASTIKIVAPISGYITLLNINQGRYVQPEETLYEMIDNRHIHLELDVFESNIAQVKEGMRISFTMPSLGTEIFAGEVRLVGRAFNMENKTVRVHGHVKGDHPSFIRGAYVEAKIWNDEATVKALPESAVVSDGGLDYIFVREGESPDGIRFRRISAKVGEQSDGFVAVEPLENLPDSIQFVTGQAYYLAAQMMKGELAHEH